jgi:hypothetical protein
MPFHICLVRARLQDSSGLYRNPHFQKTRREAMIFGFIALARTKGRLRATVQPCLGSSDEIEEYMPICFPNSIERLLEITLLLKSR